MKWFEQASDYFLKSRIKGDGDEPQTVMWSLLTAILSRNMVLAKGLTKVVDDISYTKNPRYFYNFVVTLSDLVREDYERGLKDAEMLEKSESELKGKVYYYPWLGKISKGIALNDSSVVIEGLNELLNKHKKMVRPPVVLTDDLVCVPAAVLAILAGERGIKAKPEDFDEKVREYMPWSLLN